MPECITCHETGKSQYYMKSKMQFVCSDCEDGDKKKVVSNRQHLPMWPRWKCLTHDCGSYNFGSLGRHEMPWCNIIKEHTIGIMKPKTFGGHNGDLGRNWFKDWHDYNNRHHINKKIIQTWKEKQKLIGRKGRYAYRSKRIRTT